MGRFMRERAEWKPRTELGRQVLEGKITSIAQIFAEGKKIREPEIVDKLLPNLRNEIIFFGGSPGKGGGSKRTSTRRTVRMHRSGRRFKVSALVVVGAPGYLGIGKAVSKEHRIAIEKATEQAKLNVITVRRGCGSWECGCGTAHSIPLIIEGKSGSVRARLMPAPKGLGLGIGEEGKKLVRLAGIKDLWTKILGQTRTRYNYVWAIYDAFKNLNKMKLDLPEEKIAGEEAMEKVDRKQVDDVDKDSHMGEKTGEGDTGLSLTEDEIEGITEGIDDLGMDDAEKGAGQENEEAEKDKTSVPESE